MAQDELFPLPDADIFDAPLVCLQINKDWANILSGALAEFGNPLNYDISAPAQFTKVKATMDILEALFTADEFCMSCISFRINPDNPACAQVSCDDGATWVDAFCGLNPLNGAIQQYDTNGHLMLSTNGGIDFFNGDLWDPRFNLPHPTGHIGADASCRAAENVRDSAKVAKEQITAVLETGGAVASLLGAIAAFASTYLGFPVSPQLIANLTAAITGLVVSEWESQMSDATFEHYKCICFCELSNNNPETPTRFTSHNYDEILRHVREDYDLIPRLFFEAFTFFSGTVGLQIYSVLGNNDGATCEECDCSCITRTYTDLMTTELGSLSRELSATYPFGTWCDGDTESTPCGDSVLGGAWQATGGRGGGGCIVGESVTVDFPSTDRDVNQAGVVVDLGQPEIVSGVGAWYRINNDASGFSSTHLLARFFDSSKTFISQVELDGSGGSTTFLHFENTSLDIPDCQYVAFIAYFNPVNPTANLIYIDDIAVEYRDC